MTIEEARAKYGKTESGYVNCCSCPVFDYCLADETGYEGCWKKIAEYITAIESTPCNNEADAVLHPAHYTQGDIECIDAMKAAFGADELAIYCKIAAFKYIWRCEHKNGLEDVKKAVWYLNKYIDLKGGGTDDNKPD